MPRHSALEKTLLKDVTRLAGDLSPSLKANVALDVTCKASKTLGPNRRADVGTLVKHFLLAWTEWSDFYERSIRYFGYTSDQIPPAWKAANESGRRIIQRIEQFVPPQQLYGRLQRDWIDPSITGLLAGEERAPATAEALYHEIVEHAARIEVVATCRRFNWSGRSSLGSGTEPDLLGQLRSSQNYRSSQLRNAPEHVRTTCYRYLRNYRNAMLQVSWLGAAVGLSGTGQSFDIDLPKTNVQSMSSLSDWLSPDRLYGSSDQENSGPLPEEVLQALLDVLETRGHAQLLNDLFDFGGADEQLWFAELTMLPDRPAEPSSSILIALCHGPGRDYDLSFDNVLQQLRVQLIQNDEIKYVIVVTDCWDNASFRRDHLPELQAFASRGVRILFLLSASPTGIPSVLEI